jgi:hypothetical protein
MDIRTERIIGISVSLAAVALVVVLVWLFAQ